ncbi:MAG: 5-oxoprolinase subunit PxpB [Eubacteriales bacterium]|nr:5-oxoprolinase subunit PxpB [Eubacteriales bacterium]
MSNSMPKILPCGDCALNMHFEEAIRPEVNARVCALAKALEANRPEGVIEWVSAYCTLTVYYHLEQISFDQLSALLREIMPDGRADAAQERTVVELPTAYGGEYGPDLAFVAGHAGLSVEEAIELHSAPEYLIYMMGFMPGFTYLGGPDERLHTPRLSEPRVRIPAGSVGIAGSQTGAYPVDSPGGWQLIGRTPLRLYDDRREKPILLRAGQYVKFVPISPAEFKRIEAAVRDGRYEIVVRREVV